MKLIVTLFFGLIPVFLFGQNQISGTITDFNQVPVSGASIYLKNTIDGATTDSLGNFSFATDATGTQTIIVEALGFQPNQKEITVSKARSLTMQIRKIKNLDQVTIAAGRLGSADGNGKTVLEPLDIVTTAGSGADPIAAMEMLPGVQKNGTQTGMLVRGGDASEAAIIVDGLTMQNPFFSETPGLQSRSRFNAFQFKGIAFSSGGYSARYGQAMSSVLEMTTLDLPAQSTVNLGLHMAGLYASADKLFHDDHMSVSATASYLNLSPFYSIASSNFDFYKMPRGGSGSVNYRWKTKKGGMLKLMGSYSQNSSAIRLPNPFVSGDLMNYQMNNRNLLGQGSFSQRFGTKLKWYSALSYSSNEDLTEWGYFPVNTTETRMQGRSELYAYLSSGLTLLGGIEVADIHLQKTFDSLNGSYRERLIAGYLEGEWHPVYWLAIKPGIRLEHSGLLKTTTVSPRLSASFRTGSFAQASLAGGLFYQDPDKIYLWQGHLADQQLAVHYIANWLFTKNDRTFRVEAYYKSYHQLVREHASGYDPNDYRFISGLVDNSGSGYAEGAELFLRDKSTIKNLDFWLSYSYLNTKRLYKNFPESATPSFISDHNLSMVGKYWIEKIQTMVSGTYSFASGKPYYDPRKADFLSDRSPAYHNVALQVSYLTSIGRWFTVIYAGVDNVFNRKNIFGYRYNSTGTSRYPIVPALYRSVFIGANFSLTKFDKEEL